MENKKEINHWCVLCGIGYHSCDTCSREKTLTPWRSLADTMEHYQIFMVLRDYHNQVIDRKKAQELLSTCDLSDKETYKDSAKAVLSDIFPASQTNITSETVSVKPPKKKNRRTPKAKSESKPAAGQLMQTDM